MMYYEIYEMRGGFEIWKWMGAGQQGERVKFFKTRKGAENWAKKQWYRVIWR